MSQVGDGGGAATPFANGFSNPFGMALDAAGNLYVSNQGNNTVSAVGPGGGAATLFATGFSNPSGLAFDAAGNLYIANSNTNSVLEVGPGGGVATMFATGFSAPQGIVFDSAGNLYAAQRRCPDGAARWVPAAAWRPRSPPGSTRPVRPGDRRRGQPLRPQRHLHDWHGGARRWRGDHVRRGYSARRA